MTDTEPIQRTARITGAAQGIGRAIAQALADDGHRVVIADIKDPEAIETANAIGGLAVHLAVTDSESIRAAVTQGETQLAPIDILVNNAGWDELMPFLEADDAFADRVIEVNFKGCLRVSRRVVPGMVERGYGRVVNIGSDAARVGSSLEAVYSGAKGVVVPFTKTLAREVATKGVTANAVCPGPTETPMLAQMLDERGAKLIDALTRAVPMRRLAQPADIAAAVASLASDRAGFITGQTLSVSGASPCRCHDGTTE